MTEKIKVPPFGIKDKIGYAAGDAANNFTFNFIGAFLMLFYTDVLGIEGSAVAFLFLVARFVDAFTDVGMGTIVDRFPGNKDGKFRPFIKWGAIPVALAGFLCFQTFTLGMSLTAKHIYMYITYLFWGSITYTFINIPYGSMASAITPSPEHRSELSTFRTIGATVAGLIISWVTPKLLYQDNVYIEGSFPKVAGLYALVAIVLYMVCFFFTRERVKIAPREKKSSIIKGLGNIIKHRSVLSIVAASILLLLAMMLIGSMNGYIYRVYFEDAGGMAIAGIATTLPTIFVAPIILKLAQKYGKKEICSIGFAVGGCIYLLMYFLRIESMYAFLAMTIVAYLGLAAFNTQSWAMITDVIDDLEVKNKQRDDGTVYAVYSFARKVGQALAGGLGGFALSLVGYASGVAVQTQEVANGIYSVSTLAPGIIMVLAALVIAFFYPLGKKEIAANVAILAEKKMHE